MNSVARRKQQQEDLRAKILDAARELFVNEGVEAVSMRKVADKIGYSATTLYNYFDDKEALLYALCDADFGTLHEMFKKVGKIADPIERLRKMGQTYITFALRYPSHYRFMFMTPLSTTVKTFAARSSKATPIRIRTRLFADGSRGARGRGLPS